MCQISRKKHDEGVLFNVVSVKFPEKKRCLTLEWPPSSFICVPHTDRAIGQRGDVSAVASLTAVGAPPRRDAGSRTQASVPLEAYIENRVLTPSAYRTAHGNPLSPGREFGTQTGQLFIHRKHFQSLRIMRAKNVRFCSSFILFSLARVFFFSGFWIVLI